MVRRTKNVVLPVNELRDSEGQSQAGFLTAFSFLNHAIPKTTSVSNIKKGLSGSSQEILIARLLLPAMTASRGVIQHKEAARADSMPVPISFLSVGICRNYLMMADHSEYRR